MMTVGVSSQNVPFWKGWVCWDFPGDGSNGFLKYLLNGIYLGVITYNPFTTHLRTFLQTSICRNFDRVESLPVPRVDSC